MWFTNMEDTSATQALKKSVEKPLVVKTGQLWGDGDSMPGETC